MYFSHRIGAHKCVRKGAHTRRLFWILCHFPRDEIKQNLNHPIFFCVADVCFFIFLKRRNSVGVFEIFCRQKIGLDTGRILFFTLNGRVKTNNYKDYNFCGTRVWNSIMKTSCDKKLTQKSIFPKTVPT